MSTPEQLINKMRSWLAETDGKPGVTHVLAFPAGDIRILLEHIDGHATPACYICRDDDKFRPYCSRCGGSGKHSPVPLSSKDEADHERWLRETWEMIAANALETDQGHKIVLAPRGCAALLAERNTRDSTEYCRGRDDQMKAAADQLNPTGFHPRSVPETPAELTEAEQLLKAWADILPPNGNLYFDHTKRARDYFARRAVKTAANHPDQLERTP